MSSLSLSPWNLSFTKLSRGIAVILVVGFVTQLVAPSSRQYLALVAGRFIPCVWNIFTAGLLETSILRLLVSVVGILVLARIIEPIWGSKEFLKFLGVVNLGTGLFTLAVVYVCYYISTFRERAGKALYTEVCGFHGVIGACLVAVKQLIPDTEVTLVRIVRFQAKHLPSLYVLTLAALTVWVGGALGTLPVITAGTYIAWFYLRFVQGKPGLNLRGDPSNEFRFATFFPEAVQPAIDRVAGLLARATGLTSPDAAASGRDAFVPQGLPGSDTSESARRRERGAKVLEERLTAALPAANRNADIEAPDATSDANANANGSNQ